MLLVMIFKINNLKAGMVFLLGRPRFSKFKKSIQYAKEGAWDKFATEILDS